MRLTPDGVRYLAMGRGEPQPAPFHYRWMLSSVLRRTTAWVAVTWASLAACAALVAVLAMQHGATWQQAAVAALLWAGLPSVHFLFVAPVLVDAAGMALTLGAVALWPDHQGAALALVVLAASVWEKAPIFAAAFAWHPALLVGLLAPAIRRAISKPSEVAANDPHAETLTHPWRTGQKWHAGRWRDAGTMALPWGVCLAALGHVEAWWAVPTLLAYGQLLVATDSVRLYQTASPLVCIAAALVIPPEWAAAAIVAHWVNPWRGNGV